MHWDGWSARFDEWMADSDERLMKKTEENEAKVKADKVWSIRWLCCELMVDGSISIFQEKKRKGKPKVSLTSALGADMSRTSSPGGDTSSQVVD